MRWLMGTRWGEGGGGLLSEATGGAAPSILSQPAPLPPQPHLVNRLARFSPQFRAERLYTAEVEALLRRVSADLRVVFDRYSSRTAYGGPKEQGSVHRSYDADVTPGEPTGRAGCCLKGIS